MRKTILSIGDRKTMREVLHMETECKVSELRPKAFRIAQAAGLDDMLRYSIWVGSEEAYRTYRKA